MRVPVGPPGEAGRDHRLAERFSARATLTPLPPGDRAAARPRDGGGRAWKFGTASVLSIAALRVTVMIIRCLRLAPSPAPPAHATPRASCAAPPESAVEEPAARSAELGGRPPSRSRPASRPPAAPTSDHDRHQAIGRAASGDDAPCRRQPRPPRRSATSGLTRPPPVDASDDAPEHLALLEPPADLVGRVTACATRSPLRTSASGAALAIRRLVVARGSRASGPATARPAIARG